MTISTLLKKANYGMIMILARPGAGKSNIGKIILLDENDDWKMKYAVDSEFQMRYKDKNIRYITPGAKWKGIPRDSVLVIDEVDRLVAASPENRRWILDIANLSRPWGLTVVMIARRPSMVPRDLTACAKSIIFGQVTEKLDIEYCSQWLPNAARLLPKLQPGAFFAVNLA